MLEENEKSLWKLYGSQTSGKYLIQKSCSERKKIGVYVLHFALTK